MKNLLIFLLFPVILYGQSEEPQFFSGGVVFSMVASQIDGDYNIGYHKISPSFGVYTDYNYWKKLSFRSGIFYMPKGARSGSKYNFFATRFYYAEVPFIATYYFNSRFSASLGVVFDYLFSGYYYDGTSKVSYKQLNIRNMDYAHYWSFNIKLNDRYNLRFVQNYSLIPITKSLNRTCWYNNMFFYWMFKNVPPNACWWNNVLKVSLEISLFK